MLPPRYHYLSDEAGIAFAEGFLKRLIQHSSSNVD